MRVSNLRPDVSTIFKTNIGISLPKMGEEVDELSQQKSLNRFTTQYMWNIRRGDKKVDGILAKLGFINLVKKGPEFHIYLTKQGIEFLKIKNHVIDFVEKSNLDVRDTSLEMDTINIEETNFLLKHLKKAVPIEHEAIMIILDFIDRRINTPKALENKLSDKKDIFGAKSMIRDMNRNGILARLSELNLIDRVKQNTKVTYVLTYKGNEYLAKQKEKI